MKKAEQISTENVITASVKGYLDAREHEWIEQSKVQRWINFTLALICVCSILCCAYAMNVMRTVGDEVYSSAQCQIEISRRIAVQDSIKTTRELQLSEAKYKRYSKIMDDYEKMPYYKSDGKQHVK
jgi:hypothetical protein